MRKTVIGRGCDCDIVIQDTTDVVSRRQAVITFTFLGNMTIYDTSVNGTFVNGERMGKSEGKIVSKSDTINFCHVCNLDWNRVKDPYRRLKMIIVCLLACSVFMIVCLYAFIGNTNEEIVPEVSNGTFVTDSLNKAVPPIEEKGGIDADSNKNNVGEQKKKNVFHNDRTSPKANNAKKEDAADNKDSFGHEQIEETNEAPLIY